jgi:hypothetical protein
MVTVGNRAQRVLESKLKIESPFVLDETLCLYSPQDNVDALAHPRIADWLRFILVIDALHQNQTLSIFIRAQAHQSTDA